MCETNKNYKTQNLLMQKMYCKTKMSANLYCESDSQQSLEDKLNVLYNTKYHLH